jgi:hypothetical protein
MLWALFLNPSQNRRQQDKGGEKAGKNAQSGNPADAAQARIVRTD